MFAEIKYLDNLSKKELDEYLEKGWFRMAKAIFTTNFLRFKGLMYSALWLRIDLSNFEVTNTQQKLLKQNARFEVEIKELEFRNEQEELFDKYKNAVSFNTSASIDEKLFEGGYFEGIFDTREVNIYDGEKLIATGFFDLGEQSAEGISCIYDPAYKKYSLGKYLMLLKLIYCQKEGLRYFYPGYFAPGYAMFDYKLQLAKPNIVSFLDFAKNEWLPIEQFSKEHTPIEVMTERLEQIGPFLTERGVENNLMQYGYFDAALIRSMQEHTVFDFPVFVYCFGIDARKDKVIVVYDVRAAAYQLRYCIDLFETPFLNEDNLYQTNIFFSLECIAETTNPEEMADIVSRLVWAESVED